MEGRWGRLCLSYPAFRSSFIHLVSYYGNLIIFLQFIPFQAEAKMSADLKFFKIINYISLSAYK